MVETLVEPGQVVVAGQVVVRVAHAGRREAVIELPETLRPAIGSTGRATLYGSGLTGSAKLRQLSDAANRQTRTFEARYVLEGPLADAPLGSTVSIQISDGRSAPALQVPIGAIFDPGKGPGVWLVEGDTPRVTWRAVHIAGLSDEAASVVGELEAGDRVVALGAHLLHEGERVRLTGSETASTRGRQWEGTAMSGFNLSALAVRERAVTLFLLVAISIAGVVAFLVLGRAEDPSFTIKQMTVVTAWPGATAKEMEELVAERLEKRMQELRWYDRTETFTRPGLAFTTVVLRDSTPPADVPEQFYQARKKLGDEAHDLPRGVIGPMVNDEYSDVTFALYALKAQGEPHRRLVRDAEVLRQRLLHVPGVKKVNIIGEQAERIFVEFSYDRLATLGVSPPDLFAALNSRNVMTPAGSIEAKGPQVFIRLDGAIDDLQADPQYPGRRTRPHAEALRHRRSEARLRGSGDLPDPQQRRTDLAARRGHARGMERPRPWQGPGRRSGGDQRGDAAGGEPVQGHGPVGQHSGGRERIHGQVSRRPRRGDARELSQHGMARRHRRRGGRSSDLGRGIHRHGGHRQGLRPHHARLVDIGTGTAGRRCDHRHRDDGREDGGGVRPHPGSGLCVEPYRRAHARRDAGDRDRLHAERFRQVDRRRVHQQHVLDRRHRADRILGRCGRVHALPGGEAAPEHREARGRA